MVSPFQQLAQQQYSQNPNNGQKNPYNSPFEQLASERKTSLAEDVSRTIGAAGTGYFSGTPYGIATNLSNILAMGDVLDPEEMERIREISEREGIPFDEEKYREAQQAALGSFPTPANLARMAEEASGLPITAQKPYQKLIEMGFTAGRAQPGTVGQKATAAVVAPTTKEIAEQLGVPEPFAELLGYGVGGFSGGAAPEVTLTKEKPSGLKERGFEGLKQPREVSESRIKKINAAVEKDFKDISDKIIKESPIGETAENLRNDPTFKAESRELLNEAQTIADEIPQVINTKSIKKEIADVGAKSKKGYLDSEYDKSYAKFSKQMINDIPEGNVSAGDLVRQYRKNNSELGEYFEPGASKAYNRAKRDSLLDHNRAIAQVMEKQFPDSDLVSVFKEGNARWTKIMDAETIDDFVTDLFDGKINFKKGQAFFDDKNTERIFKRALGEKYPQFEQLMTDLQTQSNAYKMLKVAKDKGFGDLFKLAKSYFINPKVGMAHSGIMAAKEVYKFLINSLLDKPKVGLNLRRAVKDLKKGDFKAAEEKFKTVEAEVLPKEETAAPIKEETIEVTPEKIRPEAKELEKPEPKLLEAPRKELERKRPEPKEMKQPKLIEYKPKPIEKQSVKERSNSIARDSFKDVLEGKKVSEPERNILKNTEVAILETRGKGQQFHGTKKPISKLSPEIYDTSSEQNIYGAGFYTTDALDIADGYSKSNEYPSSKVYQVQEIIPQKLYDAEQSIDDFKKLWLENTRKSFEHMKKETEKYPKTYAKYHGSFEEYLKKSDYIIDEIMVDKNPGSVRDLYDQIREYSINNEIPAYQTQEYFSDIHNILEKAGYDGISHKGGLLTNNPEHLVKIYWKPENLEIQEFAYPKEFKKVKKAAKPSELPATKTKPPEEKVAEPKKEEVKPKAEKKEKSGVFKNISKKDVQWYLHSDSKKPFAGSTRATSEMLNALAEDGGTYNDLYNRIHYDPDAKTIIKYFIDSGYGNYPVEMSKIGTIKPLPKINKKQSLD